VLTVREILAFGVEERMGARVELEELAAGTLTYRLADGEGGFGVSPKGGRLWVCVVMTTRRVKRCSSLHATAAAAASVLWVQED
jgi:hypothetical protein